jgi:hypothetical protein
MGDIFTIECVRVNWDKIYRSYVRQKVKCKERVLHSPNDNKSRLQ